MKTASLIATSLVIPISSLVAGCNPFHKADRCPDGYFSIGEGYCRNIDCVARVISSNDPNIAPTNTGATADPTAEEALKKEGKVCKDFHVPKWGDQTIKANG